MQKPSGGVPAGFFDLTGQIISTPLGVFAHVTVGVKQHLPGTVTYRTYWLQQEDAGVPGEHVWV